MKNDNFIVNVEQNSDKLRYSKISSRHAKKLTSIYVNDDAKITIDVMLTLVNRRLAFPVL